MFWANQFTRIGEKHKCSNFPTSMCWCIMRIKKTFQIISMPNNRSLPFASPHFCHKALSGRLASTVNRKKSKSFILKNMWSWNRCFQSSPLTQECWQMRGEPSQRLGTAKHIIFADSIITNLVTVTHLGFLMSLCSSLARIIWS